MLERISSLLKKATGKDIAISEDTVLRSDLGMNSFELVQLVCKVEDEFGVSIPDKELREIETVSDLINCIEKY